MNIEAYSLDLGEVGTGRNLGETELDDLDGQIDSVLVDLDEKGVVFSNKEGVRQALKEMETGDTKSLAPFLATEEKSVVVTREDGGFTVEIQPD